MGFKIQCLVVWKYWEGSWWWGKSSSHPDVECGLSLAACLLFFCWRGWNSGHISGRAHSAPGGFHGLYHWKRCNQKCPLDHSNEAAPLTYFASSSVHTELIICRCWAVVEHLQVNVDCSFCVPSRVGSDLDLCRWLFCCFAVSSCIISSRGSWWEMTLWMLMSVQRFHTSGEQFCYDRSNVCVPIWFEKKNGFLNPWTMRRFTCS